ncbi:MAG TPA: AsmA family protein [Verrucomicrobiae bacterium]|jgi:uncharacterized protein involved in outer membrane biogenesis|nr:AsmA family protein [Verrucomicrobiae bacterium]
MSVSPPPTPNKRISWPRKLLYAACGFVLFVVLGYFFVSSGAFFKAAILPRIGREIGAKITVGGVSISPFSYLYLNDVKIIVPGDEQVFNADNVRLDYSLMSFLRGTVKVNSASVDSPSVTIVENADGTLNVDPLLKSLSQPAANSAPQPQSSKSRRIDLKNISIKNASIHYAMSITDGGTRTVDLSGINIALDQLGNGRSGKFTAEAACKVSGPSNSVLEANCTTKIEFTLNEDLLPVSLKAKGDQHVTTAMGSFASAAGFHSELRGDVTPAEVKELSECVYRNDQLLGEINLAGPLDLDKKEGRLTLTAGPVDRQFLNLIGATMGIDFGKSSLSSVSTLTLANGGSLLAIKTQITGANLSMNSNGQPTPPMNVTGDCDVAIDLKNDSAQFQTLTLDGSLDRQSILRGSLTKPMTVAWGNNSAPASDSVFELAVSDVNLPRWQALIGNAISSGTFSLNLKVLSSQGGKKLDSTLESHITNLAGNLAGTVISDGALDFNLDAEFSGLKKCAVTNCILNLTQQGQPALKVTSSGNYDGGAVATTSQIEAVMGRLLGRGSSTALAIGATFSGSFSNHLLEVNQLNVSFPATAQAANNQLRATGQMDFSMPALTKGHFDISADTLDMSPLYEALAPQSNAPASSQSPAPPSEPAENTGPAPIKLPIQISAAVNLKQVLFREIAIQNCQMTATVDASRIAVNPCNLTLNGGAVNGTVNLDLSAKDYKYAINLAANNVPLEPIANSFSPENTGRYKGLILAGVKVDGAGFTGGSLQKSLGGQMNFTLTNADIQLTGPKLQRVVAPIADLLGLHEILTWPLSWFDARIDLGNGNLRIARCIAGSSAFEASIEGAIPIAEVLSNSPLNLPVQLSVRRSLAEKIGMQDAETNVAPDAPFIPVRNFVTIKGTLGAPVSLVDKRALGGVILNSGTGMARRLGGEAGSGVKSAFSGLRNFFHFHHASETNSASTNTPSAQSK